jgi:uncharacterized protein YigE (DUF2233 family)
LAECQNATHLDQSFTLCECVRTDDDLRLFLRPANDAPVFGNFRAIDDALARDGKKLAFAMNGGMYHPDRRPVGLYIERGARICAHRHARRAGQFRAAAERGVLHSTRPLHCGRKPRLCR